MPPNRFNEYSIFDDKGEVKRLVDSLIQKMDPEVIIESMRKIDFCYIFTLSKKEKSREVELSRAEIEASWDWRNGHVEETLLKKTEATIAEL